MKESERLQREWDQDESDNDYRALNWDRRIKRSTKREAFEEKVIPLLIKKGYVVEIVQNKGYKIITDKVAVFTFYPGSGTAYFFGDKSWRKITVKGIKEALEINFKNQ